MVARSVATDRGGAADGGQAHHESGVTARPMLQSDSSGSDCNYAASASTQHRHVMEPRHSAALAFPTSDAYNRGAVGWFTDVDVLTQRSEEHTSELQSHSDLVCRLLLEKKKNY